MSRAREFADLASSADAGGITGKNLIINGAMQVAQRGTSETGVTSGGYKQAPDRYRFEPNGIGTYTVSQSTDAPDGFSNSYKVLTTTADASPAATDYLFIRTRLEGQNLQHLSYGTSAAKTMTLSFWVRSNVTGTGVVNFQHNDNTAKRYIRNYTINSSDTWEYKTISVVGRTDVATDNDNGNSLEIHWWLGSGSNYTGTDNTSSGWHSPDDTARNNGGTLNINNATSNYWQITGVQLEVGEQATPFEHRSYGDELARCQRYYYQTTYRGSADTTLLSGTVASGTVAAQCGDSFPVTMRSAPTAGYNGSITAYDGTANQTITSLSANGSSTTNATVNATVASGLTVGRAVQILSNASDEYLTFDAEL